MRGAPKQTARLSDVAFSITDGDHQAPPTASEGVPFLTIAAINDGTLNISRATRYVPEAYYTNLKRQRKPELGDVLYSVTGSIAIPAIVDDPRPFTFQRHIAIIKPNPDVIDTRYLWHALQTEEVKQQAMTVATGTAQLTIPLGGLRNLRIQLPSLAAQRRIVAKLDSVLERSSRAHRELDRVPTLIARYKQVILAKAFSGELTADWPKTTVEAVIRESLVGLVRSAAEQGAQGTPYIRMNHYDLDGSWNEDKLTRVEVTADELQRYELAANDVLFNTRNSYELVGKVAIWPKGKPGYVYNNNLLRIRFCDEVLPQFAALYMISPPFRDYLDTVKSATTSVCAIYQRSLMAAPFPLPTINEQKQIVRTLLISFKWLDKIASEHARAEHLLPKLDQSILAKAFRGELVPQDSNDEPAGVLLQKLNLSTAPKRQRS